MNARPLFSASRLATGTSRLGLRWGHTRARYNPNRVAEPMDPTLGEQIWIFNHIQNNHVVYSHKPVMKNGKAMRQIPFNGKKLKPAALRKDYWRPMAVIQFPEGQGEVGRSVFQKMREFRKRHELQWENEEYYKLSKQERGVELNDQRANTVADIAAVLGGAGKGNKIWEEPPAGEGEGQGKLHSATVFWENPQDHSYAREWPSNVEHQLGLPSQSRAVPESLEDAVEEDTQEGQPVVA